MKSKITIALLAAAVPCLAFGQGSSSYQCSYGELQRRIEILTEPGMTVPCEVHYYKDTEAPGEKRVLWRATSQEGYCESKTAEFIAKMEGWGWDCGQTNAAMPAEEDEAAPADEAMDEAQGDAPTYDDTDVLSPAVPASPEDNDVN